MKQSFQFNSIPIDPGEEEIANEILLWRTVIDQAVHDAIAHHENPEGKIEDTRHWFRGVKSQYEDELSEPDFYTVCDLASLNRRWTLAKVEQVLKEHGVEP
jgi:hypothetical protein